MLKFQHPFGPISQKMPSHLPLRPLCFVHCAGIPCPPIPSKHAKKRLPARGTVLLWSWLVKMADG